MNLSKNKMQWQIFKLNKLQTISQNNNKLISDQLQNQQFFRNNQLEKLLWLLLSEKITAEEFYTQEYARATQLVNSHKMYL